MSGKTKTILNYLKRNKVIVKDTGVPLVYEVDLRGVAMPSNKFEETVLDFIKEVTVFMKEQKVFNEEVTVFMKEQKVFNEEVTVFMKEQKQFNEEITIFINEQKEFNQAISKHTQFNWKK